MAGTWAFSLLLALLTSCQGGSEGRTFRVTSIVHEPYLMLSNVTNARGNDLYEGFIVDLLDDIAEHADFKYEIHLVPDNRYGQREGSGRWNGMVGQLVRGEADIAAAPLTQTADRRTVVDFAYPFQPVTLTAILRRDIDIDTIEELANQTEVNYGTFNEGATQQAFIGATLPIYRRMWAHMASQEPSPFITHFTKGLQRVRQEDFAFIVERPTGEYIVNQEPCDLKLVGSFMTDSMARSFAFAVPKRHELLNAVNAAMLQLQEDMSIAKLYRKWWPELCAESSGAGGGTTITSVMVVVVMACLCLARAVPEPFM